MQMRTRRKDVFSFVDKATNDFAAVDDFGDDVDFDSGVDFADVILAFVSTGFTDDVVDLVVVVDLIVEAYFIDDFLHA